MSYQLPFKPTDRCVELGGGSKPVLRPNLDMRQCYDSNGNSTVDIIADLNEPLPLKDNEWDGVFCSYMLEHISWRKIRKFISDVFRVLKHEGTAVFITANLLEQARYIASQPYWEDENVCMIFGDQNYEGENWRANAHYTGFSPEFAGRLFKEAGFDSVIMIPWGALGTDMIIEAKKGTMNRKELFDKQYFNGGTKVGGYADRGYWDFPEHWITFDHLMKLKPESVLDVGCGRGYLLKRFQDVGIPIGGLEISKHCMLTRMVDNITECDLCETPWNIPDKYFDLAISMSVLEHIPEDLLPNVLAEIDRVSKRGMHGIDFGEEDNGFDKTHVTLKSKDWWEKIMPANHQIASNRSLARDEVDPLVHLPIGDDKLKVNVGSFTTMFHHGWINLDIIPLHDFAKQYFFKFVQHDARQKLPFGDHTVDLMYSCHFLEHLTHDEGVSFLKECKRIMKPGAVMRLILPDAELLTNMYKTKQLGNLDELNDGAAASQSQGGKLWAFLFEGHHAAYDWETSQWIASEAGFSKIERKAFRQGTPQILRETLDLLPEISIYLEITA